MTECLAPGCTDEAQYAEPNDNAHDGQFELCRRHVDPTIDGIEKL